LSSTGPRGRLPNFGGRATRTAKVFPGASAGRLCKRRLLLRTRRGRRSARVTRV
jgi:hypothetical protein